MNNQYQNDDRQVWGSLAPVLEVDDDGGSNVDNRGNAIGQNAQILTVDESLNNGFGVPPLETINNGSRAAEFHESMAQMMANDIPQRNDNGSDEFHDRMAQMMTTDISRNVTFRGGAVPQMHSLQLAASTDRSAVHPFDSVAVDHQLLGVEGNYDLLGAESNFLLGDEGSNNYLWGELPVNSEQVQDSGVDQSDSSFRTIALRPWIKSALELIDKSTSMNGGIASSAYLNACLRVAISLTKQISEAEDAASSGNPYKLRQLPSCYGCDWADCIKIRVKANEHHNIIGQQSSDQDFDSRVESFLQFFGVKTDKKEERGNSGVSVTTAGSFDENLPFHAEETFFNDIDDNAEPDTEEGDEAWLRNLLLPNSNAAEDQEEIPKEDGLQWGDDQKVIDYNLPHDAEKRFDHFLESFKEDELDELQSPPNLNVPAPFVEPKELETEDLSCLNIDCAELASPNGMPTIRGLSDGEAKAKRIYCLGIVLYELFSARAPHPKFYTLMFSEGAFVSLPTQSFSKSDDDAKYLHEGSSKRHQGPASTEGRNNEICRSSVNLLLMSGVPGPVGELIYNMLQCIYGDLSGKDCYSSMHEITSDLQLMLDKPKFLHSTATSLTELQLKQTFMPRESEFVAIQSCYRRSISGLCEIAIIEGESGTGKTWLSERVGRYVAAQGGMFLAGKFEMPHGNGTTAAQQVKPFSALAAAFDSYCDTLLAEKNSDWAKGVVFNLHSVLGRDVCHLIQVIPKLSRVILKSYQTDFAFEQNGKNAMQRLCYLLSQFLEVITTNSKVSVTLFLDDLQWADHATFVALNQLLLKCQNKKFFFLGCCRDNEKNSFMDLIPRIRDFGIKSTSVTLKCMSKETLKATISDLLCLSPRIVRSLSEIVYSKTKGNPLFFYQIMLSLNRDGLIRIDHTSQRWQWDEEEIQSQTLPEDVAKCFTSNITKLPSDVQMALHTLSMFGAQSKLAYLEMLETQLGMKLVEPLKIAAKEGLVCRRGGSFHFCHDRIQESAYALIDAADRLHDHSTFGLCLMKLAIETGDDDTLFMAANQVNLGGPSVVTDSELVTMVQVNVRAGKRAIAMSDFSLAAKFFEHAKSFLPINHWVEQYSLSLELFELASKSALVTGNIPSLNYYSAEVAQNGRSYQDKLDTYYIVMSSLVYSSQVSEALVNGCRVISQLGENLPISLSHDDLVSEIQRTQSLLLGIREEDFLSYMHMVDRSKLMAMKFLAKIESIAMMVKPALHPFVTLKMVQLTVTHGLSPFAPIGFVYFGSLLAKRGDISVGNRFALLANSLLNKLDGAKEVAGEVMCIVTETQSFAKPLQSISELRVRGESAALAAGDVNFACINRLQDLTVQLWAGENLLSLKEKISEAIIFMKQHSHKTTLLLMLTCQKTALTLIGDQEALTDRELLSSIQQNGNPRQMIILSFHRLYLTFMLGEGILKERVEQYLQLEKGSWFLMIFDSVSSFIVGLVSFQLFRETRSLFWAEKGQTCKKEMKNWAEKGSKWNFEHRYLLLEAEGFYSEGNYLKAEISFHKAIECSRVHKFVNDEALACELVGKFYFDTGDAQSALAHFKLAHQKYIEFGARAKSDQLFAFMEEKFGDVWGNCTYGNVGVVDSQQLEYGTNTRKRATDL